MVSSNDNLPMPLLIYLYNKQKQISLTSPFVYIRYGSDQRVSTLRRSVNFTLNK